MDNPHPVPSRGNPTLNHKWENRMAEEQVSAKITDGDPVQVQYDFGTDLDEAVELFGAEVVFSRYKSAAVIDLQAYMRGLIRQEKPADEIEEAHQLEAEAKVLRARSKRKP